MKKLIYIFTLISAALLTSCLKDDKDIFDDSAANRVQAKLDEVNTLLKEADNGWLMEYYPGKDQEYGGFNVLMRFISHDSVIVASEITDPDRIAASLYRMISDAGPVLTFDTYNDIFHFFSDPINPGGIGDRGEGMNGDYEFILQDVSSQEITFKGKKTHNMIVMTPLPTDISWEKYLENIDEMSGIIREVPSYQLKAGDKAIETTLNGSVLHFSMVEGETAIELDAPFIITTKGIKFYRQIEIAGKKMQEFTLAEDQSGLVCTTDPTVILSFVYPPINEVFATTTSYWIFNQEEFNTTMAAAWKEIADAVYAGEGEILQLGYIGMSHTPTKVPAIGLLTNAYAAVLGAVYTPEAGTEDELSISYTKQDVLNWQFYESYFRPFLDLLEQNSPFKLVGDSKNPTKITFTSTKNADVTFVVEK